MRQTAAGIIIGISFLLGMLLAAVVDRWQAPAQATFHVLDGDRQNPAQATSASDMTDVRRGSD